MLSRKEPLEVNSHFTVGSLRSAQDKSMGSWLKNRQFAVLTHKFTHGSFMIAHRGFKVALGSSSRPLAFSYCPCIYLLGSCPDREATTVARTSYTVDRTMLRTDLHFLVTTVFVF